MRILTKLFFCIFTLAIFNSCEPEEIPANNDYPSDVVADTGDQEGGVYKGKKNED